MHQKDALGFSACRRDANNAITVTTHRAVLASTAGAIELRLTIRLSKPRFTSRSQCR
jgi:hypothetical protein